MTVPGGRTGTAVVEQAREGDGSSVANRSDGTIGWAVVGFVIWIAFARWPIAPAAPELDASWQQALSHALAHGVRFGRELVFTFGPLGGPEHARYEPALFWPQIIVFEFLFKGLLAWRWVTALRRWTGTTDRIVCFLALVSVVLRVDACMLATILVIAGSMLRDEPRSRRAVVLDCVLLSAIGFIKFTYLVFVAGAAALVIYRGASRSRREGIVMACIFAASTMAVWIACGQVPWDLPLYVWRSGALALGYSESQAYDGNLTDVHFAIASLCATAGLLATYVFCSRARYTAILVAICVAGGTFVAFRASFIFHGDQAFTFFAFALVAPVALVLGPETGRGRRVLFGCARAAALVLALGGYVRGFGAPVARLTLGQGLEVIEYSARGLARLPTTRAKLETKKRRLEEQYALPRTRAIVGSAGVDFVGVHQAWIFLNGLRWKPRPVLQSYATTTAGLIALDGDYYESDDAPEFVLYQGTSVCERLFGTDDSAVLRILMRDYTPVALERGLLLLRRDPRRAEKPRPATVTVAEFDARPGEVVDLAGIPGRMLAVRFDVRYSLLGKLRRFFYHAPITTIDVRLNDQHELTRRLVPGMARAAILMRPALEFDEDWLDQYTIGASKRVTSFRVGSSGEWNTLFAPTYRVTVERWDDPSSEPAPSLRTELVFGSFPTRPFAESGAVPARPFYVDEREYVILGPLGEVAFEVEPGPHRLLGLYGLVAPIEEPCDGVDFTVALVSKDGTRRAVFERTLDRSSPDANRASFHVAFESRAGEHLVIAVANPAGRDADFDLPYLEKIEITR